MTEVRAEPGATPAAGTASEGAPPAAGRSSSFLPRAVTAVAFLCALVVAGLALSNSPADLRRSTPAVVHPKVVPDPVTSLDPGAFTSGACVAYAPTVGDNHKTVFLDAGHGGIDPGGVGTTPSGQQVEESTVNLAIELDATALLRSQGYRVVVSRTGDTTVALLSAADVSGNLLTVLGVHDDVAARDACANLAQADALVGIYMDAGYSSVDAGSVALYDTARPFTAANEQLAGLLQSDVLAAMNAQGWQIPNDGALPDSGYGSSVGDPSTGGLAAAAAAYDHLLLIGPAATGYFTDPSNMPGAILEPLYLTDPYEASIASTAADQAVIAQGIASAVEQFLTPAPPA
jgi:N-acetylmuramoyl-L-alanine amidase